MRLGILEVGKNITIRAHINDAIFTTESTIATVRNGTVILRLSNVEQFDRYAEKTTNYSLCLKSDSDVNYISDIIQVQHSASNPYFIAVSTETELISQQAVRSHARYAYEHELMFTYGTAAVTGTSIDISSRGLGILFNKQIPVGTFGYIDIWNPLTGKARAFQAKVANCKQVRPNVYKTGILFENAEQWILDFINDFQNHILEEVS